MRTRTWRLATSACAVGLSCATSALATTKGLNQIVTPDIQPAGVLSVSYQQMDPTIGNPEQVQLEMGLTKRFEIAVFQGFSPSEQIGNAELGLVAKGPWLLSTGFLNWTTKGTAPQPFIEGGFYQGNVELIAGAIRVVTEGPGVGGAVRNFRQTQTLAGLAYHVSPRLLLQSDYQGGSGNFASLGFTYSITPTLSLNPALYVSNASPHKGYGYAVLTWNIALWTPRSAPSSAAANAPVKQPGAGAAGLGGAAAQPHPKAVPQRGGSDS